MSKVGKPRKRGNGYEINWTDGSGKRRFKTLPTHAAALKFLRAMQAEADAVQVGAIPAVQVDRTWTELVELWYEVKHAKRTLDRRGHVDERTEIQRHGAILRSVAAGPPPELVRMDLMRTSERGLRQPGR